MSSITISDELKNKFPDLIALILESESMNDEEREYWINILPIMSPEQLENLREILENEKKQLAAIDQKYAKEIEKIGQKQLMKKTQDERRKKREKRVEKEEQFEKGDDAAAESLLEKIEEH